MNTPPCHDQIKWYMLQQPWLFNPPPSFIQADLHHLGYLSSYQDSFCVRMSVIIRESSWFMIQGFGPWFLHSSCCIILVPRQGKIFNLSHLSWDHLPCSIVITIPPFCGLESNAEAWVITSCLIMMTAAASQDWFLSEFEGTEPVPLLHNATSLIAYQIVLQCCKMAGLHEAVISGERVNTHGTSKNWLLVSFN